MRIIALIIPVLFFSFCRERSNLSTYKMNDDLPAVRSWNDAEAHKNRKAHVYGRLQAYTPNKVGKGAGYMFWDYEILLGDSNAIPAIPKSQSVNLKRFLNRNVVIVGNVFYGVIIGSENPDEQSATGYRIDADEIREQN